MKNALSGGRGDVIRSNFLIATVTLAVTLTDLFIQKKEKTLNFQGFQLFHMAVRESS